MPRPVLSSTVENYLKAVLAHADGPETVVPVGKLAAALEVTPGTVTTMVKGLAIQGLLKHLPRQGVRLTAAGRAIAVGVLRKHRLVETFLVQVLKMDWADVHEEAEALEHAISDRVLAQIDTLLGHPQTDPYGDSIPNAKLHMVEACSSVTLASCPPDKALRVVRIRDHTPAFLQFIQQARLKPGAKLRLLSRDRPGGVVRCEAAAGEEILLGLPEAGKIEVAVLG